VHMSNIPDIFDVCRFSKELSVSGKSSLDKVEIFKNFLSGTTEEMDEKTKDIAKKELQGFQDVAHFKTTTPW